MQIFGLHRNIYKLARYGRTQELLKEEGQRRLKLLGDWEILKRRKVPDAQIARVTGISRATYYRRKRALKTYGLAGVERRSTRPHRLRRSRICTQWNGGVERGNRTFREDFYARKDVLGNTLAELQQELKHAVHKYNTFRPHQALKGLTPFQYTQSILEISLSQSESHML